MGKRIGRQEPRISVEPGRRYTDGADASELVSAYGLTPDPWQRLVLDAWLGRDAMDKFTATTCGLSVPRQDGKNAIIEMDELYHLVAIGSKILHTAHEVRTARKAFMRLVGFFTDPRYPELQEIVATIRRTNGQEAIELTNGASIEFSARSKGAARGFTVDLVVFDEAQFLTDEQMEAIMSTMAAAPLGNRQLIFTGTPPSPTMPCEVFGRVRGDALAGTDARLVWHEWSVEAPPRADTFADVLDAVYDTNPAMGIRLDEDFTEQEFKRLTDDGFARERLGWWMSEEGSAVISSSIWDRAAVDPGEAPTEGVVAYGVKFSADGATVALAAARKPKDAPPHVELVEYCSMREGTSWLAEWLIERKGVSACVAIDGKSSTDPLIAQMREAGYPRTAIRVPRAADVAASASMLMNALSENNVTHIRQKKLDACVAVSRKRKIGNNGGWGWGAIGDADPTPLEAVSLAHWAVLTTKRNPARKAKVF